MTFKVITLSFKLVSLKLKVKSLIPMSCHFLKFQGDIA